MCAFRAKRERNGIYNDRFYKQIYNQIKANKCRRREKLVNLFLYIHYKNICCNFDENKGFYRKEGNYGNEKA